LNERAELDGKERGSMREKDNIGNLGSAVLCSIQTGGQDGFVVDAELVSSVLDYLERAGWCNGCPFGCCIGRHCVSQVKNFSA